MDGIAEVNGVTLAVVAHVAVEIAVVLRVMLRPHREPASRIAWIAIVASVPLLGALAYLFFGEVNIGRRRVARIREVLERMPPLAGPAAGSEENIRAVVAPRFERLSRVGQSISGFEPIGGNTGRLLEDSNATIDAMVADIDAASDHVHVLFYIWLPDGNGLKVAQALMRAATRGVTCRAIADDLGSRIMIGSAHWQAMRRAGVQLAAALPIGNPLLRPLTGRIDLRNHRKIVVIDGHITYCGSQNCADPEFRVKARYAPWVDAMIRFEGPVARQNQHLFAGDWMTYSGEDMNQLLAEPIPAPRAGFTAQVIGTGPTVRYSAMPEMFEALFYVARDELVISTPYYVPNESMQTALCASAYRGVRTTIIVPARNDSWIVSGASRSFYAELLEAGVDIHEYVGGLLHTKSVTVDREIALIGSANMDRRSFDLNYENNILFHDADLTAAVRARQQAYIARSRPVSREGVRSWSASRRIWNNGLAMLGPVL
jgi:cardiolipin synthase A/B